MGAKGRSHAMTPNQITGLQAFARYMVDAALDGGDVDGGTIQEIAHQYGLLTKREMKGPCREPEEGYCACAFESGFPVECYQPTDALIAKSAPAEPDAELVELLRSKFPRIDPCKPVPLDEKAHCCEYTIYVERERLHRMIDAKMASLKGEP